MAGVPESQPEIGPTVSGPSPPSGLGTPVSVGPEIAPTQPTARRNRILYAAIAVVVVVVLVVAAFAVFHPKSASPSGSQILIPASELTSLPIGQLAAVDFTVHTPSVLNGTYSTEFATTFWILTGYEWTNATRGYVTLAQLEVDVPAGGWVFAMINENQTQASDVGWITALTVSPN
jgi:hypothetical protein